MKKIETRWHTKDTWVCTNHIPPIMLPASLERCWLCPGVRPPVPVPPKPKPVPSKADKRRGATVKVPCALCGHILWRRPQEIAKSKSMRFVCGKGKGCKA